MWVRGLKLDNAKVLNIFDKSHPVWVRGLKLALLLLLKIPLDVAPRVGAWIETTDFAFQPYFLTSHPVWVRGLKQQYQADWLTIHTSHPVWVRGLKLGQRGKSHHRRMSHPVWVRGLKLAEDVLPGDKYGVAPRVGAWIETRSGYRSWSSWASRTPCGCVD